VEGTDPQPDCGDHGIVVALPVVVAVMSLPLSGWESVSSTPLQHITGNISCYIF
jgi:hypothetical protein